MEHVEYEEGQDVLDYWNSFDFAWKSCEDVQHFVDAALASGAYQDSIDAFGGLDENWYTNWFTQVQDSIKNMAHKFSDADLYEAVDILMAPFSEIGFGSEFATYDALLKFVPNFPFGWPKHKDSFDQYYEACLDEFSYLTNIGRYFNWTFSACDTIALMENIDSEFLNRIFVDSFSLESHQSFRVRLCLAKNPKTPRAILNFMLNYQNGPEWLLMDFDQIKKVDDSLLVDSQDGELSGEMEDAQDYLNSLRPYADFNPLYLQEVIGIALEPESGTDALKIALTFNSALTTEELEVLYQNPIAAVRYFIRKNPSCPDFLKAQSAIEQPSFSYTPYDVDPSDAEEVTLN
jgi:hypothetical protein